MEETNNNKEKQINFSRYSSYSQKQNLAKSCNQHDTQVLNSKSINIKIASLMIKVRLSNKFDQKQFKFISSLSPEQWIYSQKQLLRKMNQNKNFQQKYFRLFHKNHEMLSNWYLLASKQKSTILPYIFKQFLTQQKKKIINVDQKFSNEKLKQEFNKKKITEREFQHFDKKQFEGVKVEHRFSTISSNQFNQSENVSFMKPTLPIGFRRLQNKIKNDHSSSKKQKQQVMGIFFNNLIELNTLQHRRKPLNLKLYKLKRRENIDVHDLYIKTFDACNGRKYIFYDYQKHMKGLSQKNKYNGYLRKKGNFDYNKGEFAFEEEDERTKRIRGFEQFERERKKLCSKEKCSLLPVNMVLNQKSLNNQKGLRRVVRENGSSKIVFVNHQGKPITYYIKDEQKGNDKGNTDKQKRTDDKGCKQNLNMKISNSITVR